MDPPRSWRTPDGRGEMPFLDHLEELRWRILWSLLAIGVATVVGWALVYHFEVAELLLRPARPYLGEGERLKFFSPVDPFFLLLRLSLLTGVVLAFPVVVYHVWAFFAPALERRERRIIIPALYLGFVLFAAGVALAYFVGLPLTLPFLMGFLPEILEQSLEVNRYFSFVVRLLLAFGILFELPVVIMILSALGLVSPGFLREKRRYAWVGIAIVASFLSPGDAIVVTLLMVLPLALLYEVSIFLAVWVHPGSGGSDPEKEPSAEPPEGAVEAGR